MPASRSWTGKVFCNLVQMNVPMGDPEEKLRGGEYPDMKTPDAGCLKHLPLIQVPQRHIS